MSEVHFRSETAECAADLYVPDHLLAGEKRPGVVIGHGSAMVKEALSEAATHLVEAGYVVLALDYRSWGKSGGEPRALLRPVEEVEDFQNAISYLQTRAEVDPDRIGIWGVSFGGGVVLHVAAIDRRVRCVVAQSPGALNGRRLLKSLHSAFDFERMLALIAADRQLRFKTGQGGRTRAIGLVTHDSMPVLPGDELSTEWMELAEANMPSFRADVLIQSLEYILDWAPERYVSLIAPTPMMIVTNGAYDLHHPLDHIQEIFREAGEPKSLRILPYDVVGLYSNPGLTEAMSHAIEWFDSALKPKESA